MHAGLTCRIEGLLIQLLLKPTDPFFKISLRNVGNLRRGGGANMSRGGGERERVRGRWSEMWDSGCRCLDERNQILRENNRLDYQGLKIPQSAIKKKKNLTEKQIMSENHQ